MAVQILSRRSSTIYDRPFPIRLGSGELAINNNAGDPGLFFADDTASPSTALIKIGPTHVGATAPNVTPVGYTSSSKGESWLDTASTHILKFNDGTAWKTAKAVASVDAGLPANPVDGQLHFNTTTGKLNMYRLSTTAWVVIGP